MNSIKKTARTAGLLYLLLILSGLFGMMYVPSKIFTGGDAAAILNNIKSHDLLFRLGIAGKLICQVSFIFLVLTLHRLFKEVNKNYALIMVTLVVVAVPIAFLNELNQIAALVLLSKADMLSAFRTDQINALAITFLDLHRQGIFIVEIFWGLWLIPFGLLVYKSGFIPRVLGILLMIACFGYLAESFTNLLFPHYGPSISGFALIPSAIGEFSIMFWLIIKGARIREADVKG